LSHSLSQAPTYQPPAFEPAGSRHTCGCRARSAIRLQSASGDLRFMVGEGQKTDVLDTVIDIALIGGAAILVYEIFFG
jgi:hypothetical protein